MITLEFESWLAAGPEAVWTHATSPEGINHELGPWLEMSLPAGVEALTPETLTLGQPLGRSWIRLLGVLPVDYDDLCVTELRPFYFREESVLMSQRQWRHERWVEAVPGGCRVRDRLHFQPRLPGTAAISRAVVQRIFRHRHRRLVQRFGALTGAAP